MSQLYFFFSFFIFLIEKLKAGEERLPNVESQKLESGCALLRSKQQAYPGALMTWGIRGLTRWLKNASE